MDRNVLPEKPALDIGTTEPTTGWDPHTVWRERVHEPRQRAAARKKQAPANVVPHRIPKRQTKPSPA
jgi:hypothetical protein